MSVQVKAVTQQFFSVSSVLYCKFVVCDEQIVMGRYVMRRRFCNLQCNLSNSKTNKHSLKDSEVRKEKKDNRRILLDTFVPCPPFLNLRWRQYYQKKIESFLRKQTEQTNFYRCDFQDEGMNEYVVQLYLFVQNDFLK